MSKKVFLFITILSMAFITACQPDPAPIDSTYQPRDNRQLTNNEMKPKIANANSMNSETSNANSMMNTNSASSAPMSTNSVNRPIANAAPGANANR